MGYYPSHNVGNSKILKIRTGPDLKFLIPIPRPNSLIPIPVPIPVHFEISDSGSDFDSSQNRADSGIDSGIGIVHH